MAQSLESMLNEFREEAATTKRVLSRVPQDKLGWKPHEKSMSLGQLALHIAVNPARLSEAIQLDEFDPSQGGFNRPSPETLQEVHDTFEDSVRRAEELFSKMSDESARGAWRLTIGDKELFSRPRIEVLRSIMLNHWYHHRGQLSVYLRLLDVPVPSIYGPSADESPF